MEARKLPKVMWTTRRGCGVQSLQLSRGWNANHEIIQEVALAMTGCPQNTKYDLEDGFAHLSSLSKLSNLSTAMNKSLELSSTDFELDVTPSLVLQFWIFPFF